MLWKLHTTSGRVRCDNTLQYTCDVGKKLHNLLAVCDMIRRLEIKWDRETV
jgi:hypothetical protein